MRLLSLSMALASAGLLAACGGSPSDSPPPATNPGTPSTLTLTGVVAQGAAMASATVTAKCATGTGTATSDANGVYTLTITSGALPCVLEATASDASLVLHSVATGSTDSATANITTLTELLVARLSGQNPTSYMAALDTSTLGTAVTTSTVSSAQTAVLNTLIAAGVDTTALGNLVTSTLVAATSGTTGNGYDLVLDQLAAALNSAGTTLTQLTDTVAANSPASPTPVAQASDLPPELLLRPQTSHCAALRSGSYRVIKIAPSLTTGDNDTVTATQTMSFDAATLTANFGPGDDWVWTAATRACHFQTSEADIVVSPSGVIVARALVGVDDDTTSSGGQYRMLIALPVQTIAVADLAGTWNMMGWDFENAGTGAQVVNAGINTVNSSGAISNAKCFADSLNTVEASCTIDQTPQPVYTAHADGGFDVTSTDPSEAWKVRAFAYRAGNGELMVVWLNAQGEMSIATKYRAASLPALNQVSTGWNIAINNSTVAADLLSTTTNTISALNGDTVTRLSASNDSTVTVAQHLVFNSPRAGLVRRTPETVNNSDGVSTTVREMYSLRLAGMGLSVYAVPSTVAAPGSNGRYGLSINTPASAP